MMSIKGDSRNNDSIAHAKALLIEKYGMSEKRAHRYLQQKAMDACITKEAAARLIIDRYLRKSDGT